MKIVKLKEFESAIAERDILAALQSKFVCRLNYAFLHNDSLYFVLDLKLGGDLKKHLQRKKHFDTPTVKFWAAEILLGLEYIHSRNIIFRDLKLQNVLLSKDCNTFFFLIFYRFNYVH